MLLGVNIINFDVFDNDVCGIMIDDYPNGMQLSRLSALIGRNQTGKSSFINCLSFLKDTLKRTAADASTRSGRPGFSKLIIDSKKDSIFKLFFKIADDNEKKKYVLLQYELYLVPNRYGSPRVSAEKLYKLKKNDNGEYEKITLMDVNDSNGFVCGKNGQDEVAIDDSQNSALSIYGRVSLYNEICLVYKEIMRWFFCRFSVENRSSYFVEGNAPGGHKHLNSEGTNCANVIEYLRTNDADGCKRILSEIKGKIPNMKGNNLPDTVESSPDRLFLYLLLLRDPDPNSTIFIETPDKDLYHDMVDVLANEMRQFSLRKGFSQIVFSTHNPYILETMSPHEIWLFKRMFDADTGDVSISCVGSNDMVKALSQEGVGMGAIWYGGYLD